MPVDVRCLDETALQQFVLGKLPLEQLEARAAHVEGCPRCGQKLEMLKSKDTLVETLAALAWGDYRLKGQAVADLIQRIKEKRPPDRVAAEGTVMSSTADITPPTNERWATSSGSSRKEDGGPYDFLSPSEDPEDLGRLGPYRVVKLLGAGGMGLVFQAIDPQLRRQLALKVMKPELAASTLARQRFLREARAMAALPHDHIVPVYQVGADGEVPFLAMPLLKGESLEERILREGKLPVAEVLRIGREIAEGLAAAHEAGLVHRDVKPSNVWLEGTRGRVKLLDFGLARPLAEETTLTQSGMIAGTPHYMAPEQANAETVDRRCDLFSLGSVLYRLGTGQLPFRGKNHQAILFAVATEAPKSPQDLAPELPAALTTLMAQLLSKNPDERPATARSVVEAIERIERQLQQAPEAAEKHWEASMRGMADAIERIERQLKEQAGAIKASPSNGRSNGPNRRWLAGAAALFLAMLLGAIELFSTRQGTLVVKVPEPHVIVFVDGQEKLTIDDTKVARLTLSAGEHFLAVKRDNEELFTTPFLVKIGREETIEAKWDTWRIPPIPASDPKEMSEPTVDLPPDDAPDAMQEMKGPDVPTKSVDPVPDKDGEDKRTSSH